MRRIGCFDQHKALATESVKFIKSKILRSLEKLRTAFSLACCTCNILWLKLKYEAILYLLVQMELWADISRRDDYAHSPIPVHSVFLPLLSFLYQNIKKENRKE